MESKIKKVHFAPGTKFHEAPLKKLYLKKKKEQTILCKLCKFIEKCKLQ